MSTQMQLLVDRLREQSFTVVAILDPGATNIGRHIRRILLDATHQEMAPMPLLLLMLARIRARSRTLEGLEPR